MKLHSNIKGEGFPLLILHGFLGMGDNWKTLANAYAKEQYEVHLIDQRNHGRSPHAEDFSYELMAEDLKTYLVDNSIEKASVIGHSMGGKTAMWFATLYPEHVDKLIVVDIAPKYYAPHHQQILEGLTKISEAKLTSRTDADCLLSSFISEVPIRQFLLKNLYWKTPDELNLRLYLEALKQNIEEVGKGLPPHATYSGDTLFIRGGASDYIKDSDEEIISDHFKTYTLQTIQNAGHWLHAEKRDEFFEMSLAYLKS